MKKQQTVEELAQRQREIMERIEDMNDVVARRKTPISEEEERELTALEREYKQNERELTLMNQTAQREAIARANRPDAHARANAAFREWLKTPGQGQDIHLEARTFTGIAEENYDAGIGLTIKDVIPPKDYGLIYDKVGCPIQTGVRGNIQWPVAGYLEAEFADETDAATEQTIDLSKVTAIQQRMTVRVKIANDYINDASFDLIDFVSEQCRAAIYRKLNLALCSTGKVTTNFYGPFAHDNVQTTTFANGAFTKAKAMEMVGMVAETGVNGEHVGFVMSPTEFYKLKATPVDAGSGIMVIGDDNTLSGFPVAISRDINYTLSDGDRAKGSTEIIGCGDFSTLPLNQHGSMRVSKDASSALAASDDVTIVTINAYWSLTHLDPTAFVKATEAAAS